jgi:MoxR-like ATPase
MKPTPENTAQLGRDLPQDQTSVRRASAKRLMSLYTGNGPRDAAWQVRREPHEQGQYLADPSLRDAVHTALALERALLVTGEPGTGKTALAWSIASELGLGSPLCFYTRSDNHATDLLYHFDHVLRFYEAQTHKERASQPDHYLHFSALGRAILEGDAETPAAATWRARFAQGDRDPGAGRRVVLIDEIDKAPRDFPNDLLDEIDRMAFRVKEIPGLEFRATYRPIIVITNNSERQLPDAFLRRCVFHWIKFPKPDELRAILRQRIGRDVSESLLDACTKHFQTLRGMGERNQIEKSPATAELEAWVRVLMMAGVSAERIQGSELSALPHISALLKTQRDLATVQAT